MVGKCNGGHYIEQTLLKGWQEIENIYWQKIVEMPIFPNAIGALIFLSEKHFADSSYFFCIKA
jgi:hypothetical protein